MIRARPSGGSGQQQRHVRIYVAACCFDNEGVSCLSESEVNALHEALGDELKAWATYDSVIHDFGPIRPFINIRDSEARHIDALLRVFRDYGLTPPDNPWAGKTPRYESVASACADAVHAEIENTGLYERIMRSSERPEILAVFRNLHDASQQSHLPAFRRCMQRNQRQESA